MFWKLVTSFVALSCALQIAVNAYSTSDCIYSCDGQDDGEYQACEGCQHYYSCSGGSGEIQDCGWDSEWDDNQKSCVDKGDSSSCCDATRGCITSCDGVADGDFQSCSSCGEYITCAHGMMYTRPCGATLEWDDCEERCVNIGESATCDAGPAGPDAPPLDDGATGKCAASCDGRPDGTYQSCDTCSKYITCASGTAVEMACPAEFHPFLAWDSDLNTCARGGLSQTCVEPPNSGMTCIRSCEGEEDGLYQACDGCGIYIECSDGAAIEHNCDGTDVWDDVDKQCVQAGQSRTCKLGAPFLDVLRPCHLKKYREQITDDDLDVPCDREIAYRERSRCVGLCPSITDATGMVWFTKCYPVQITTVDDQKVTCSDGSEANVRPYMNPKFCRCY